MKRHAPRAAAFLVPVLLALSARAQETWSLTTADLKTESAAVQSIDAAGVHLAGANAPEAGRVVPWDQFVQLSRPVRAVPLGGRFALHLVGGGRVGGEPVGVKGENLLWNSPAAGEIEIPLRLAGGLTKPDGRVGDDKRREDVVTLINGDTARGSVVEMTAAKVTLQTDAGPTDLPMESVVSVAFASSAAGSGARDKAGFRVRLDDGSTLLASAVTLDGATLNLTPAGKAAAPRPIDLARVADVEQTNGPVSWLSSRAPAQSVYTPFFGSEQRYPARMNVNYAGDPIRFKDHVYARGVGVHAYSKLVYVLDGKTFTAFRTRYALDPGVDQADVTVRVKLDDKIIHEKTHFGPGVLSPVVVADLGDAKTLTLEVDFGSFLDAKARLSWIEPALMKVKPAPESSQPAPDATQPPDRAGGEVGSPTTRATTTQPAAPGAADATTRKSSSAVR